MKQYTWIYLNSNLNDIISCSGYLLIKFVKLDIRPYRYATYS